jgi:hypothetical protein
VPVNVSKLAAELKAEIKATDRKVRSDKTTIHYSLGDQPITPSAPLATDDLLDKTEAATVDFVPSTSATSTLGETSKVHKSTEHAFSSPTHTAADISVLLPHLSPHEELSSTHSHDTPPPSPHVFEITSFDDELNEMAEAAFGPTVFTGSCEQDPEAWHNSLLDYIEFKAIPDDKRLSFFKLRLADGAKDWLNALPATQKDTFDNLTAAFLARFKPKDLEKYRFAKELLNLRQTTDQSVDQFITILRRKAALAAADEKTQVYSALNGLIPTISGYVLEHNPKTLDDVLTHARVAELTRVMPVGNADDITKHLAKITEGMSRLDRTVSNLTTANVYKREASASPGRRQVSFDDERTMPLVQQRSKTPPPKQEFYDKTQHHRISRFEQGGFSEKRQNFHRPSSQGLDSLNRLTFVKHGNSVLFHQLNRMIKMHADAVDGRVDMRIRSTVQC